jgi:hypothetical protein
VIDVDGSQLRHLHDRCAAEKAMPYRSETRNRHDVESTSFAEVGIAVLTAESYGRIMVLPADNAEASRGTPQEVISRHSREDRVRIIMTDQLDTSVKIIRGNKWTRALHEDHDLWLLANHSQLVESMEQRGFR